MTQVLLVEDNKVNQLVAKGVLNKFGLTTDIAENGVKAIEALKQACEDKPYTLILMDCQMPEMDGYEASLQIRSGIAGERYQNIPIIAMTANAMQGDREKCLTAGMSDYLSKPIHSDRLYAKLCEWLNR
ncbi:MAG: response regulator [Gammaproteobacteria bacterium]|nr:response regulator [Gammaproteobacteria bacterium]